MPLLVLMIVIGSAAWVYADAKELKRKGAAISPGSELACVLCFWIIFFPMYIASRGAHKAAVKAKKRSLKKTDLRVSKRMV